MVKSTITSKFTDEELAFLLAFEANEKDLELHQKRNEAYESLDLNLATKLERVAWHSQLRLHRRYNNLQMA